MAVIKGEQPDITESDAEFATRQNQEKSALESKRKAELASLRGNIEAQRVSQTAAMRTQYDDTLRTLQTKVWTVTGSAAVLTVGAFDRNAKTWPFSVGSADPTLPMVPVALVASLGTASDPKAAIIALDTAVKANALAAEFDWGLTRDAANKRYAVDIRAVRVRNLTNNETVVGAKPQARVAYFAAGKRNAPIQAIGTVSVTTSAKDGPGDVYIDGMKMGKTPFSQKMGEGSIKVEVKWDDRYSRDWSGSATLAAGSVTKVAAVKTGFKFGEAGPAGGMIFYDKGSVSGGWRYLEAAPSDQSSGIQWFNGNYIDIKTGTAVGSGKANTEAIIAAQGGGNYAAALCKELSINGFSDWFLPSKDELDLMYKNLKKANSGGFGEGWLWSSSQYHNYFTAWTQRFSDGGQYSVSKVNKYAVRACRAF